MLVGCGIGCDHGQMWWNDAITQDNGAACEMRCNVVLKMWCDVRCGGAMHDVANIWCDLKLMWRYVVRL